MICRPLVTCRWALFTLLLVGCAAAGDEQSGSTPAKASSESPSEALVNALLVADPLGEPPLRDGLGGLSMKITTDSAAAQRFFDQGLALLHGFWDFEARRAFLAALRLDRRAPMAWWGLYMSLNYNQHEHGGERRLALDQMAALRDLATSRERRYLDSLLRLDGRLGGGGQAGFLSEMQALVDQHPEDVDGPLFLVKFLLTDTGGYFVDPGKSAEDGLQSAAVRAVEILEPLLAAHPENFAVHHYWIHAQEYGDDPARGLPSARRVAELAPGIGHILHMPGHVHFLIGQYGLAREAFLKALDFDQRYLDASGVAPADHWNYVHNLDYLVATCAEDGRYLEGLRWAAEVSQLEAQPHRHKAVGQGFLLYAAETAPVRLHMRYGAFGAAAQSLEKILADPPPSELAEAYLRGLQDYAVGMEAVRQGDVETAGQAFQRLTERSTALRERAADPGGDWYFGAAQRLLVLATFELNGNILSLLGRHEQAVEALERAVEMERQLGYWEPPHYARPVLESLGEAHLRAGRPAEARAAFEQVLEIRPGSGHAWFGIARSRVLEGDTAAARVAMQNLLDAWPNADPQLPQIRDTKAWLAANPR